MQNSDLYSRLHSAIRDLREAEDKLLMLLEELESSEDSKYIDDDRDFIPYPNVDSNGIQWSYTSGPAREGDDLPCSGTRGDDPLRYINTPLGSGVWNGRTFIREWNYSRRA